MRSILLIVPISYISLGSGFSIIGSFWVARKRYLSPSTASSTAWIDFSRPTNKGRSISVKITTSLTGSNGSVSGISSISSSSSIILIRSSLSVSAIVSPVSCYKNLKYDKLFIFKVILATLRILYL